MMGGPMADAAMTKLTTTMPSTARRLRLRRFHASFQSDVPTTGSSMVCTRIWKLKSGI